MGYALGGCRDLRLVRHAGDGALVLRGLGIGLYCAGGVGVDAGEVLVVTLAFFEGAVLGVVGGIVGAADTVKTMLTEVGGVGTCGVAGFEAEGVAAHETGEGKG